MVKLYFLRRSKRSGAAPGTFLFKPIAKSSKLANVCYDIRGPVLDKAREMEGEGQKIIKLNIGNPGCSGSTRPDEIVQDMIRNMPHSAGYTDSRACSRRARRSFTTAGKAHPRRDGGRRLPRQRRLRADHDEPERALLDSGDEVLIPAPDYPLWTASVALSGGTPVHYLCDEQSDWMPDIADIRRKVTPARGPSSSSTRTTRPVRCTRPTCCSRSSRSRAREHELIIVFADEIYDKTLYDGNTHTSIASLADDVLCLTFNGLSKNYRSCGYRAGWMVVSGEKRHARDYIEGLNMLANDAPVRQHAGAARDPDRARRLPEHQGPGGAGRAARRQRDLAYQLLTAIPGSAWSSPRRRCTCSRAWTRRSTRSPTTSSSPTNCSPRRRC